MYVTDRIILKLYPDTDKELLVETTPYTIVTSAMLLLENNGLDALIEFYAELSQYTVELYETAKTKERSPERKL